MRILIIQTSPGHTASTLLVNAIYGLIPELSNKKIIYIDNFDENFQEYFNNIICIKTHDTNIDEIIKKFKDIYKLYFICSDRKEFNYLIDDKYRLYENVIIFEYEELNETDTYDVPMIINNIYNKLNKVLKIDLNIDSGIKRIHDMNKLYNDIKMNSFEYIDDFFQIHGSHRNRNKND
jgi:hypothetical protein